jgi:hypothetical protein
MRCSSTPGAVRVVQMAVVEIVRVALVQDGGMTAVRAVLVGMVLVRVIGHGPPFSRSLVGLLVDFILVDRVVVFCGVLERVRDELDDVTIGE